jgi:hypothetical protein
MIRLFPARRRSSTSRPRWVRPCLERLETRFCPSSLSLSWTATNQNNIQFGGTYSAGTTGGGGGMHTGGGSDADLTVVITGQGWSQTTMTNASGGYSITVPMSSAQSQTVTASMPSDSTATAQTTFYIPPPQITNFTAVLVNGNEWVLSGTVTGTPNPYGMSVNFSGATSGGATVGANGSFSAVCSVTPGGVVCAVTTDWWGQESNVATEAC